MNFFGSLKVKRGIVKRAEFNALLEVLEKMLDVGSGAGVAASFSGGGLTMALTGDRDRYAWAKITAAPPAGVPVLPSACRYSALALGRNLPLTDVLPVYGREVTNDEVHVYPAKVGDLCLIFKNPQASGPPRAELWVLTEKLVRGGCNTP